MRTLRPMWCFVGPHRFVYVLHYAVFVMTQQNATFWGLRTPAGAMTPNSNLTKFVQCTYHPSFIILSVLIRKLSCWQTNPQTHPPINPETNKQTPPKISNVLRYATTLGNNSYKLVTVGLLWLYTLWIFTISKLIKSTSRSLREMTSAWRSAMT